MTQMARVALYGSGGAPYHHAAILAQAGHRVSFVFPQDIEDGALAAFDAFVMPGGGYRAMQGQLEPLGTSGCRAIREFVEGGGMYVGSCAGSYDAATVPARFLEVCPVQAELRLLDARVWNEGDSPFGVLASPGIGELIAGNSAPAHPVMAGMPAQFSITHYNGPFFTGGQALARVIGAGKQFTPAEEFLGGRSPQGQSLLVDRAAEAGAANIVAGTRGAGRVVLFGSHPEFGLTVSLDDLAITARLLANAIDWQLAESGAPDRPDIQVASERPVGPGTLEADLAALPALADRIKERTGRLRERTGEPWLDQTNAMSMLGLTPREVWTAALDRIPGLADEAARHAGAIAAPLVSFEPPAQWPVDGGFQGIRPLLTRAERQLEQAEANWRDDWPGAVNDGYDYMLESPYHLVAGSYLAAIGQVTSAALLSRVGRAGTAARA
jgi:Biotin-protein ligase, N terminal